MAGSAADGLVPPRHAARPAGHPLAASLAAAGPALAWTAAYVALVALPLLVLLAGEGRPGLGFWWDVSMGLGFAGLAVVGVQFGLTARFHRASAPFGIDILYWFHRWMGVVGLALLAGHYAVLRLAAPQALAPSLPWDAPAYMTAGRIALLALAAVVVTSLWRKQLGIEYDRWRVLHAVAAVLAVLLAAVHVAGVRRYAAEPVEAALLGAYTAAWAGLVLYVRVLKPWRLRRSPWRVADVRAERDRAWTLTLEPVGHAGMPFQPGQFAWLTLGASPFAAREHPFSFSGSAAAPRRLEFTIKELGDFTNRVGATPVGSTAYVDGPHGVFTVDRHPAARGFVFVAGGVGIAPVMSMLRTLADRGDPRPHTLVYANDRWDDVLFREELERLGTRLALGVTHVLRDPPEGWTGERGLVDRAVLARALPEEPETFVYFLCGPGPMTDAVQHDLRALGVPLHRIHFELFDLV